MSFAAAEMQGGGSIMTRRRTYAQANVAERPDRRRSGWRDVSKDFRSGYDAVIHDSNWHYLSKLSAMAFRMGYRADYKLTSQVSPGDFGSYRGLVVTAAGGPATGSMTLRTLAALQDPVENGSRAIILHLYGVASSNEIRQALEERFGISVAREDPGIPLPPTGFRSVFLWRRFNVTVTDRTSLFESLVPGPDYQATASFANPRSGAAVCIAASRQLGAGQVLVIALPQPAALPVDDKNVDLPDNTQAAAATLRWLAGGEE
jgi:hypothetical protein